MRKLLLIFIFVFCKTAFVYGDDYFDNKKEEVILEFGIKLLDKNHELSAAAKKSYEAAKK